MSHYKYVHEYLAFVKWARDETSKGKRVRWDWADFEGKDAVGFRAEFLKALDKRISAKGGLSYPKKVDERLFEYKRDKRYLEQWRMSRIVGAPHYGGIRRFASPEMNRRFPDCIAAWND